ncbi:MAG: hypothetical protein ACRDSJ_10005 [Rubrobacteraceae bacterium]
MLDEYRAEQRVASERLQATAIADLPQISAWRRVFTGFCAKPTQHRNAAEALLRRLAKHGEEVFFRGLRHPRHLIAG